MSGTVLIEDIPRLLAEPAAALAKLRRAILEACGDRVYCGDCERPDATIDDDDVIRAVEWEVRRRKDAFENVDRLTVALYEERERCGKLEEERGRLEARILELERRLER